MWQNSVPLSLFSGVRFAETCFLKLTSHIGENGMLSETDVPSATYGREDRGEDRGQLCR